MDDNGSGDDACRHCINDNSDDDTVLMTTMKAVLMIRDVMILR